MLGFCRVILFLLASSDLVLGLPSSSSSATSNGSRNPTNIYERLFEDGLRTLNSYVPRGEPYFLVATPTKGTSSNPDNFRVMEIGTWDPRSRIAYWVNNIAGDFLWSPLHAEVMPKGITQLGLQTWPSAPLERTIYSAFDLARKANFPGPWGAVYVMQYIRNPSGSPAESHYVLQSDRGSASTQYICVGFSTGNVITCDKPPITPSVLVLSGSNISSIASS